MDIKKIHFEKYKCFKEGTIDNLKPINIIIGKNNIGKSSILDVIEMIYNPNKFKIGLLSLEKSITENEISQVFHKGSSGGGIPTDHYAFGKDFIGEDFLYEIYSSNNKLTGRLNGDISTYNKRFDNRYNTFWERLAIIMKHDAKITKRILAERNIFSEPENESMEVDSNGNGVTRIISNFINKSEYNESLVKDILLNKLNEIMGEDATFTEIITQQIKIDNSTRWEIFLREEEKGRIPLSASGSGLKAISMVLVYTILIPEIEKKKLDKYIFMFEELENNLHPSLQRRLLKYIEEVSKKGAIFFLTTHSNVLLDSFQNNDDVNILHIQKNNNQANISNSSNDIQKNNILNDLGIKASDLLQSNGIIWVEGPSDRVYINKWLNLWSGDAFKEGKDYQCVFYGGRLLSNLTLDEEKELINLMKVNRNSIIIMDSDKKNKQAKLNDTKKRIIDESLKSSIMCWVTKGREIENYIPEIVLKKYYGAEQRRNKFNQFDNLENFLESIKKGQGIKFLRNKTEFAKIITKDANLIDYRNSYDLNSKINEVIKSIASWNKK